MAEFSDYVESRILAPTLDGNELMAGSKSGLARKWTTQQIANLVAPGSGISREVGRAFSEELLFNKNSIYCDFETVTSDITYSIAASGNLVDQESIIRQTLIMDGVASINFSGAGFVHLYGITDGQVLNAGEYEIFFVYLNGAVSVSLPGSVSAAGLVTREFNRTFVEALVFNKNEIFHSPISLTGDLNLTIGAGGLVDQASGMRLRFTTDGTHAIFFGPGFDFLYGITSGAILDAGTYELYFLYTNGSAVASLPGTSSQSSGLTQLLAPASFAAVADGENAIDLSWSDVTDEVEYQLEKSLTGTGGWVLLSNPVAGATSDTDTGLNPGDTVYYRIKAIGDGVNFADSPYSTASATTETTGDVTAPTFTFLPASGNTVWPVNKVVTLTANEGIRNTNGTTIDNTNIAAVLTVKQTNSGGSNIAFTATIDATKTIITITPTTQFGEAQLVYIAINNVEDVNGNEVTVAISSTFTTTAFTFLNGTTNRLQFGDILDPLFTAGSTNFWLELTVTNMLLTGWRPLVTKYDIPGNQRSFQWYAIGTDVYFGWVGVVVGWNVRVIKWTNVLTAGEHVLVLKYNGATSGGDGLDRMTLLIDGATAGSKTLFYTQDPISGLANATAQLTVGAYVNNAGVATSSNFYTEEAKDFIVRSASGATVEINVPNLKTGVDISGNARHGTWV